MDERTTGLILRIRPLTESSLIVQWLTSDLGRIATVARGARRPRSPLRGKLDLFYEADLSFARSRRSDLHTLREVTLRETHAALREDLGWLQQASYAAALIEQTTETETALPTIFSLLRSFLQYVSQQPPRPLMIFAFEMKMLRELGLQPDLREAKVSGGSRQILERLAETDWAALLRLKLSLVQTAEIRRFLNAFLIYHLNKIPAGRDDAVQAGVKE
jgi:DNA repair protein RecO (recombination protein O)